MFSCTAAHKLFSWCLLKQTAAGCLIMCVYADRQSHPYIRSLKQIQMTVNALPPFHSATQHTPKILSCDCTAPYAANSSSRMGWRNSGTWRNPAWRVAQQVTQINSLRIIKDARRQRLSLPSICCKHSRVIPATATQENAACGATSHLPKYRLTCPKMSGRCNLWGRVT